MNKSIDNSLSDDCVRIKDLGYSSSHHIRLYGQRFDIVSDPFPDGNGVAVEVTTAKEPKKESFGYPRRFLSALRICFRRQSKTLLALAQLLAEGFPTDSRR